MEPRTRGRSCSINNATHWAANANLHMSELFDLRCLAFRLHLVIQREISSEHTGQHVVRFALGGLPALAVVQVVWILVGPPYLSQKSLAQLVDRLSLRCG